MEIWLDLIRENNLYKMAQPASQKEVDAAEELLELTFAPDYKEFLLTIGASICFGHEIMGIAENENLNVVISTKKARKYNGQLPHSWYVIEDTHIDGILIMQSADGSVYQISPDGTILQVANNMESYLTSPIRGMGYRTVDEKAENNYTDDKEETEKKTISILKGKYEEARIKLKNPDQVEIVLLQTEKKLEAIPGVGDWLSDVPAVISLIRSYIKKEYKDVPVASIIAGMAALIYLVSPVDLIPDYIPGAGLVDDAAIFVLCWKMIHDDVDKYQAWRKKTGREKV